MLRTATLSSLCRLRDISLRPEGVFQGESQERGGKALGSHFGKEKKYYDTFVQPEILKNQNFSLDFMAIKCIMQSNR